LQTSGTASANTPVKCGVYTETIQTTAKDTFSASANTTIMDSIKLNAQTGYEVMYPMGQEIIVAGGTTFGIDATPGANISTGGLNLIARIKFEE
jgi:hypothetical protein